MYAYIDRPISILSTAEHFLLAAMRLWTASQAERRCPAVALMDTFENAGAMGALRHFNMAMMLLAYDGRQNLVLSANPCCLIGESEAVLLTLWSDLARGDDTKADATIALLVTDGMFVPAARAFAQTVTALTNAGIDLRILPEGRQEAGQ